MNELSYVLAQQNDIKSIVNVFSESFPESIKWKMKFYSKLWLRDIIKSTSCEVWICKETDKIIGVIILVNDYKIFGNIRRRVPLKVCLFINILFKPLLNIFFNKIKEKLTNHEKEKICMQFMIDNNDGSKSLSLEQLAILPKYQGKGYGTCLLRFAQQRAITQGYKKLSLLVDSNNRIARHLYVKNKFVEVR